MAASIMGLLASATAALTQGCVSVTSHSISPPHSPTQPPPICEGRPMGRVVFFIIDTSEGIDLGARRRIAAEVKEQLVAPEGGSTGFIVLYPNTDSSYEPVQLEGECSDPDAPAIQKLILLSETGKKAAAERVNAAQRAITNAADQAMRKSQAGEACSPLAETLIYAANSPEYRRAKTREIFLYSDMRQHSRASTVYGKPSDPAYFRHTEFRPTNLLGATLHVLHLDRDPKIVGDTQLMRFWSEWVKSVNGNLVWTNN